MLVGELTVKAENNLEELIEEFTLALMFLTSFKEGKDEIAKCWKSYDWHVLDRLAEKGDLLKPSCYRTHSRFLHDKGVRRAENFLNNLGFDWAVKEKEALFKKESSIEEKP